MNFRDLLSKGEYKEDIFLFSESLDTSFNITKEDKSNNIDLHHFNIIDKQYRIFIEDIDKNLHIGFERKKEDKWITAGQTGDLTSKEVLTLFGTIKKLLLNKKFYSVNVASKEIKKLGLYRRMMEKLTNELNSIGYNFEFASNDEYIFLFDIERGYSPKKFKFKAVK